MSHYGKIAHRRAVFHGVPSRIFWKDGAPILTADQRAKLRAIYKLRPLHFEFLSLAGALVVVGPVVGSGGFIDRPARLDVAADRARRGSPTGLYEPAPGWVSVHANYAADGSGEPTLVNLLDATWRALDDDLVDYLREHKS